jgi:hypothetical protein
MNTREQDSDMDAMIAAAHLIEADRKRTKRDRGDVVCPKCGGVLRYVVQGVRTMRAACDECKFALMS